MGKRSDKEKVVYIRHPILSWDKQMILTGNLKSAWTEERWEPS